MLPLVEVMKKTSQKFWKLFTFKMKTLPPTKLLIGLWLIHKNDIGRTLAYNVRICQFFVLNLGKVYVCLA